MARDDDEDLYDEEFDFVDDDDEEAGNDDADTDADADSDVTDEADEPERDEVRAKERGRDEGPEGEIGEEGEEPVDEYGRPEPKADYVVHVYEHKKFKRTIERPFTAEDAEAFATEFNRTSKSYGRVALAGKVDTKPKKALD
jgi:hypothetical protein